MSELKNLLPENTPQGQKQAVNSNKQIITVTAGAGTGKTWVLSNRYARLLLSSNEVLPKDILTLTYTETAASEMKSRIEERVIKILNQDNNISLERKNKIIDGFGEAWISTIHAFARRIINESGLNIDIEPNSDVISAPQEENFWNDIAQAVEFGNLRNLARAYGEKDLQALASELDEDANISAAVGRWGGRALSYLANKVSELHASLGSNWQGFLNQDYIAKTQNKLKDFMQEIWREVFNTWGVIFDNLRDVITEKGEADLDKDKTSSPNFLLYCLMNNYYAVKNQDAMSDEDYEKFYSAIVFDKRIRASGYEPFKSIKAELGMTLGDWRKTMPDLNLNDLLIFEQELYNSLKKFCALSWGLYDKMKARRGLLSFGDMILHAKSALSEQDNLKSFKYILVDEFQDTDPLQFSLIKALINNNTGLFAVGDLKQSIYSFRHAAPDLFAETINNSDENIELDVSFRTRPELLSKINSLFADIWKDGLGKSLEMRRLKFKSVNAARNSGGNIEPLSFILCGSLKADEFRAALASALARQILFYVNNNYTVWDKALNAVRPVKFSDFTILFRTRTAYDVIEQAFNDAGVPSRADLSNNYFSRGEVGDIINLLKACADKEDNASLAGWLVSPFSGVARESALKFIELAALKNLNIYEVLEPEILARLNYLANIGLREGPAELIAIFDRNRTWLECYKEDERLRAIRNIRSAVTLARSFQSSGSASSLTACADWMARAMRRGVSIEEPSWHDPNDNSVLLTTIFKSKGLEYPVTIIFDDNNKKSGRQDALKPSKELGLAFTSVPDELDPDKLIESKKVKLNLAVWNKFFSEQGEADEDMRLFYVAATRAQDALIICGNRDLNKDSWTALALRHMIDTGEISETLESDNIIFADNLQPELNSSVNNIKAVEDKDINLYENLDLPDKNYNKFLSLREFSATSFALYEWCPLAWRMRYSQGINLKYSAARAVNADDAENLERIEHIVPSLAGAGGAEIGSLAHWLLAKLNLNFNFEDITRDKLPYYLRAVWDDEASRGEVLNILDKFKNSQACLMLKDAGQKFKANFAREADFKIKFNNIILSGSMDLVWNDNGNWHVLDYKTALKSHAPDELYKSQLEFYALVLRELAVLNNNSFNSVQAGIIYLRDEDNNQNEFKTWPVTGWDNLRQRVLSAAHNAAANNFEANLNHCALCPWRGECVNFNK